MLLLVYTRELGFGQVAFKKESQKRGLTPNPMFYSQRLDSALSKFSLKET